MTLQQVAPQVPQGSTIEFAVADLAKKLLSCPYISQEQVEAWQKTVLANLHDKKRAPFAVCDIVPRVLWPQLDEHREVIRLQLEVEKILKEFFNIKDPETFINTYNSHLQKASLLEVKKGIQLALFTEVKALLGRYAQATDDERIALFKELQKLLFQLNDRRDAITADDRNTLAILQKALKAGDMADDICQQLAAISITSTHNARDAQSFVKKSKE